MDKEKVSNYLKPIARGLFGKQRQTLYERPQFKERALSSMMQELVAIPDAEWMDYAFSREPLRGRIGYNQRQIWMKQALACGSEWAHSSAKEYRTRDPIELASKMGAFVEYPTVPEAADRVLFAEFREPNKIRIYMDAVDKAKKQLLDKDISNILGVFDISSLLLAHELFHMVEEKYKNEIWTKNEKICLWKIGPVKNNSRVIALSEIAAMAFAKELNDIRWSPFVMDVFLVYGYSPQEASGLYEEMIQLAGRPIESTYQK